MGIKWLMGIAIVGLGIGSLLATSEPPAYPSGYIELVSKDFDISYATVAEVCPNDDLLLRWGVSEGNRSILSAVPSANINPELINTSVEKVGEMTITVKDKAEITLIYDERNSTISQTKANIKLISQDVCSGYPMDIRGDYTGTMEQTLPKVATLNRTFEITWLNGEILASVYDENSVIAMTCSTFVADDSLTCIERTDGIETFKLEGNITMATFEGNYLGKQKGSGFETDVAGTFSFTKTQGGQ